MAKLLDEFEAGELVYVPSDVQMYQFKSDHGAIDGSAPSAIITTTSPASVLCAGREGSWCKILYKGACWHVLDTNIYPHKE
ncbi:MAG TPA: hypothetical protein EYN67_04075 [Flavobacteriales bacterium]|nr:hypothetical protein [Flavobacteriales bacterium]